MDTQERFPDRPDLEQAVPPPPPSRRRPSKKGMIATLIATVVIATTVQLIGGPDDVVSNALLQDDFSDQRNGWITGRNATRDMAYDDGGYRVRVTKPAFQQYTYATFDEREPQRVAIEVDASHTTDSPDGFLGVVCPTNEGTDHGYAFMVHPAEAQFLITEHDEEGWRIIRAGRATAPLSTQPIRITAECFGAVNGETWLVMSVDGEIVLSATDPQISEFEGVGLSVWSRDAGTEALFDNLLAIPDISYPALAVGEARGADVENTGWIPALDEIVLSEDFSDPGTGWFTETDPAFRFSYVDGFYEILVDRPLENRYSFKWFDERYRSIGVDAVSGTARYATRPGTGGLMCVATQDPVDAYVFGLDQFAGRYSVMRIEDGGEPVSIADGRSDAILDSGFTNRVQGRCTVRGKGSRVDLSLYVNGVEVTTVSDVGGFDRMIGMGMYADSVDGGTDIRFDELLVSVAR